MTATSPSSLRPSVPSALSFGRDLCGNFDAACEREWLVTNGVGGYAAGTVGGALTRKYHGLLQAAATPPVGRFLRFAKLDETVSYRGWTTSLAANEWGGPREAPVVEPRGFEHIERFHLEGTTPVWTYAIADALIEKRIWMRPGRDATCIHYTLVRGGSAVRLSARALVNNRSHHSISTPDAWTPRIEPVGHGVRILCGDAPPMWLLSTATCRPAHGDWYRAFHLRVERDRGYDCVDHHAHAADVEALLQPGESLLVIATTGGAELPPADVLRAERAAHEQDLLRRANVDGEPAWIRQLVLAADQFIVRRGEGWTVIAGYPWFGDWGRDTMIALPGLTLATGRHEIAASILRTFAKYVDRGMIPNRFPDSGEAPEYNTADAALLFIEAIAAVERSTGDEALARELFPAVGEIIRCHRDGTRHGIGLDPADGLLRAGEAGLQLTWMDARIGDWVVTPRIGKPVEINALWFAALANAARWAKRFGARGVGAAAGDYEGLAARAHSGFARFWNAERNCCYDVLDGPLGHETLVRPNQLLAASLDPSPLSADQRRRIVDCCSERLLTSMGLRTLAPDESAYCPHYAGDQRSRDASYHLGTAWPWLIGSFVSAHQRAFGDAALARSFLAPFEQHVGAFGLGSISEVADADAPHRAGGCPAQAWSVAEVLRAWRETGG